MKLVEMKHLGKFKKDRTIMLCTTDLVVNCQ
jgi:hypothetical protein